MSPWRAQDIKAILSTKMGRLAEGAETSSAAADQNEVANAIFAHPTIGVLATNARAAFYLSEALAELSLDYSHRVWSLQLDAWAPAILTRVVHGYMTSNGIQRMSSEQRRLITACKVGSAMIPDFHALQGKEVAVATSLVQYNVEGGKNLGEGGKKVLVLVSSETFAITISAAMVVVLYAMAGIPSTLMSGWKAKEDLFVALYSVRQLMLSSMTTFVNETSAFDTSAENHQSILFWAREALKCSLGKLCLFSLNKQVKPKPNKSDQIFIPMVETGAVLLNGDKAPFADVIAPDTLIQAKLNTRTSTLTVDLDKELQKCSLLTGTDVDTRVLQGLVAMWRGMLVMRTPTPARYKHGSQHRAANRIPQESEAFPENLLRLVAKRNPVKYAVIQGDSIFANGKKLELPPLDEARINFILATNVDKIKLNLASTSTAITITKENLDENLEINVLSLTSDDQEAWAAFQRKVRKGIKIKFLLTSSE